MSTDLAIIESGLVVSNDAGEPIGVVIVGTGEIVSLDDLHGLALWRRTISDLKYDALRPVERLVDEAIYAALDRAGTYTIHTEDGLVVTGESRGAWQDDVVTDAEALRNDLIILRKRDGSTQDDAEEWVDALIKTERTLSAKGRATLDRMAGAYRDALAEHTQPLARARKTPSVRRAK